MLMGSGVCRNVWAYERLLKMESRVGAFSASVITLLLVLLNVFNHLLITNNSSHPQAPS